MRTAAVIAWVATAGTVAAALVLWPTLPDRFPIHFDAAGRPDGFADRSLGTWLLLPGIATGITFLLAEVLPRSTLAMARRGSRWLNVPDRQRFLALPPEARERALQPTVAALALAATWCALMFAYIVVGSHRVATGDEATLPAWPVLVAIAAIVVTVLIAVVRTHRAVAAEAKAAAAPR